MINIDSNQGRIGEFWWINSNQMPITKFVPLTLGIIETGMVIKRRLVRWGTCGYGRHLQVQTEALPDD